MAEEGEAIVGYILAYSHLTFLASGPVAWVEELMVASSRRRSGLGSELMAATEEWARDTVHAPYIALASRRAGDFYRAIGYDDSAVFFKKSLIQ